ncbi:hypothetical protein AGMMS50256_19580 [Betaproteobacteria bacterium]|nr:hypothetical protein AGMMS50256_19580 [Betaproteobacteria bacterium]
MLDFQIFFFNIKQARPIIVLRQNLEHGVAMRKTDRNPVFAPVSETGQTRRKAATQSYRPKVESTKAAELPESEDDRES